MTKRRVLPRAILAALVLVAVPAAADAPSDQYERFDTDAATIKDAFTTLEWDRRGVITNVTSDIASSGCGFLASLGNVGRLPTVKELLTLLDEDPHTEYEFGKLVQKMIDQNAFRGSPVDLPYWTSTPAQGVDMFWTVSFSTGAMQPMAKSAKANARCVR